MKWYKQTWATILFLFVLTPVGIILMWRFQNWSKNLKIVLTVFFGIIFILACGSINKSQPNNNLTQEETIFNAKFTVKDVLSGSGNKIGTYATINVSKKQLNELKPNDFKKFYEERVEKGQYNWVSIKADDGTGIFFNSEVFTYGKMDDDGRVSEIYGYYISKNGKLVYVTNKNK